MENKNKNNNIFSTDYYVKKYSEVRHRSTDLFDSERYFIPRCLSPNIRVLDIGCAAGGFSQILSKYEDSIEYFGVDISDGMINAAKMTYPQHDFKVIDDINSMGFKENEFDLVQSWGVTVHEPDYKNLIIESWRILPKILIFDMRLKEKGPEVLDKNISYTLNPGGIRYHYVVANIYDFVEFLLSLKPRPKLIEMYGYVAKPNKFSFIPDDFGLIYMSGIGVYKGNADELSKPTELNLNMPNNIYVSLKNYFNEKNITLSKSLD